MSPRVVAVVLAAGHGGRMGGPKALLAWPRGRSTALRDEVPGAASSPASAELPLGAAHAVARLAAEACEVLVVVRESLVAPLVPWLPAAARLVVSHAPDAQGQAGSLAAAAAWLECHKGRERPAELVLVTPVDCPPASADVTQRLVGALAGDPTVQAARPRHAGRRGHPVVLRASLLERYLVPEPPTLRALLASLGAAVRDEPSDDSTVLADLDDPADVAALGLGPPRFFP